MGLNGCESSRTNADGFASNLRVSWQRSHPLRVIFIRKRGVKRVEIYALTRSPTLFVSRLFRFRSISLFPCSFFISLRFAPFPRFPDIPFPDYRVLEYMSLRCRFDAACARMDKRVTVPSLSGSWVRVLESGRALGTDGRRIDVGTSIMIVSTG